MKRPRFPAPAALLVLALCVTDCAQPPRAAAAALRPALRVRVTVLDRSPAVPDSLFLSSGVAPATRFVGRLVSMDPRTITFEDEDGHSRTIPHEIVALFESSSGRRSRAGRGAVIGLLGGAVGGIAMGVYLGNTEDFGESQKSIESFLPVALGLGGALVGCGLGALVGGRIHTETWHSEALP